ncbi:MAG: helix-turn-helix transcriptional regulator [Phenylobacterium sp.]|uniref:helix-turn-helix transcriptional regulator n=1 Tax=Phenylobacterium sp. TaxID=1871053 RepID=UPI001A5233C2|nr:helix-turn-helix transcriptional regulator [Phenylobacterium sp.]MBL8770377.1 helix-turn-helix transcriptional regulator [Phenylobacterium sp.]
MTKGTAKALATLRHMSAVGLPAGQVFRSVAQCLRELAAFDSATLVLYDDAIQVTDAFLTHDVRLPIAQRYFDRWFNREEGRYFPTHAQAARGAAADVFRASDFSGALWDTELYDEVFQHLGFYRMASVMLRVGDRAVGNLSVGRPSGGRDFNPLELRRLNHAAQLAALALSSHEPADAEAETEALETFESAFLVMAGDGGVQSLSLNAVRLLRWAALTPQEHEAGVIQACLTSPDREQHTFLWARPLLQELARRLIAAEAGRPGPAPVLRRRTRYGEMVMRAFVMQHGGVAGPELIGVEIKRRTPLEARLFASPTFRNLTPQEQVVCRRLLRGASQPEIAREMSLSPHTVVSHVRNLYRECGVSSREDLKATILQRQDP